MIIIKRHCLYIITTYCLVDQTLKERFKIYFKFYWHLQFKDTYATCLTQCCFVLQCFEQFDGKHSMENFNTVDLRRFPWPAEPCMHKIQISSKQIRRTNDIKHSLQIDCIQSKLFIEVLNRSESIFFLSIHLFWDTLYKIYFLGSGQAKKIEFSSMSLALLCIKINRYTL